MLWRRVLIRFQGEADFGQRAVVKAHFQTDLSVMEAIRTRGSATAIPKKPVIQNNQIVTPDAMITTKINVKRVDSGIQASRNSSAQYSG